VKVVVQALLRVYYIPEYRCWHSPGPSGDQSGVCVCYQAVLEAGRTRS